MSLHVITSYYNPFSSKYRYSNYLTFYEQIKASGVPLLTAECVVPGQPQQLKALDNIILVESDAILWQKERLLNIIVENLPSSAEFVAWIDCDVFFDDPAWPNTAIAELKKNPVIQLFSEVSFSAPQRYNIEADGPSLSKGFVATITEQPSLMQENFEKHGHTGFAWAIRRDILNEISFFDECIVGGADHAMAHTFAGNWNIPCVWRLLGKGSILWERFDQWSQTIHRLVNGSVGVRPGRITHLWHGSIASRRYLLRNQELDRLNYNPEKELIYNHDKCWTWSRKGSKIANFVEGYMIERSQTNSN